MKISTILLLVALSSAQRKRKNRNRINNEIDDYQKRIVCYYTNWSVYRKGSAKYEPQNINPYLCTHLIYSFGGLSDDFEVIPFDSYQDIDKGGYSKFNGLKQYNKKMKTLLAIGGWNEGSARFSELVAFPEYRDNFTTSVIRHLRRYNFDGLDLDWEYPAAREGSAPEDKANYATLVEELRSAFEEEGKRVSKGRLLLTMAVPAGKKYIDNGYDVKKLNKFLDFINILAYDYHSVFEPQVNHHAALMPPPGISEYEINAPLNVEWTVNYYVKKGASKNKLVVGIPTYGRAYTLLDPSFNTLGSSADGPGVKGNYTNEKGYMAFYEVCEAIAKDGWEVRKPYPKRMGPFAFKGNQWVGYDDEHMAARKAEYVLKGGLGGIMFWSLDSDDFRGFCNGQQYPIIESAKKALLGKAPKDDRSLQHTPNQRQSLKNSRRKSNKEETDSDALNKITTPEPPTTPGTVADFKCRREGFFPNPDNCHKYYWCLSSGASGLGVVPHAFTCPGGLIFNKRINGCDNPGVNVKCDTKARKRPGLKVTSTTQVPTTTEFDYALLDDYYYYYDDEHYDADPAVIDPIQKKEEVLPEENQVSRNSPGGNRFAGIINEVVEEKEEQSAKVRPQYSSISRERNTPGRATSNVRGDINEVVEEKQTNKAIPQYSSISRERPRLPIANEDEIADPSEKKQQQRRPSYVNIERARPAGVKDGSEISNIVNEPTNERELEYVTIRRRIPAVKSTTPSFVDSDSDAGPGLEYATVKRIRPSTSTTPETIESQNVPVETTTEKIPTTSKPLPKIKVPILLQTRSPLVENNIDVSSVTEKISPNSESIPEKPKSTLAIDFRRRRPNLRERRPVPNTNREEINRRPNFRRRENLGRSTTIRQPDITATTRPATRLNLNKRTRIILNKRKNSLRKTNRNEGNEEVTDVKETKDDTETIQNPSHTIDELFHQSNKDPQRNKEIDEAKKLLDIFFSEDEQNLDFGKNDKDQESIPLSSRNDPFQQIIPKPVDNSTISSEPAKTRSISAPEAEKESDVLLPRPVSEIKDTSKHIITLNENISSSLSSRSHNRRNESLSIAKDRPITRSRFRFTPKPITTKDIFESTTRESKVPTTTESVRKETIRSFPLEHLIVEQSTGISSEGSETTPGTISFSTLPPTNIRSSITPPSTTISSTTSASTTFSSTSTIPSTITTSTTERVSNRIVSNNRNIQRLTTRRTSIFDRTTQRTTPFIRRTTSPTILRTTAKEQTTIPRRDRNQRRRPLITEDRNIKLLSNPPRSSTTPRPEYDYIHEYYDDGVLGGDLGHLASLTQQAQLEADGTLKCFDTGYFPHPNSCKRFISCSKTVKGDLRGWIYTCPQELVFDPVGGMCNWTEDVDCLALGE